MAVSTENARENSTGYETLAACPVCAGTRSETLALPGHWIGQEVFAELRGCIGIVRCGGCGLVYTNPRPSGDRLRAYYSGNTYICHETAGSASGGAAKACGSACRTELSDRLSEKTPRAAGLWLRRRGVFAACEGAWVAGAGIRAGTTRARDLPWAGARSDRRSKCSAAPRGLRARHVAPRIGAHRRARERTSQSARAARAGGPTVRGSAERRIAAGEDGHAGAVAHVRRGTSDTAHFRST